MAANTRPGRARHRSRRAGLSILEITIAIALLTVALCGITGSIVASDRIQNVNRESALAEEGVRQMLETLHGVPFTNLFAMYNSSAADNPVGVTCPGPNFTVAGLRAAPGDADGRPGEIIFPTATVGGVLQLRENVVVTGLGMPRDLNGDGFTDGANHAADYRLLPVRVQVRWDGASGVRTLTTETLLCTH